MCKAHRLVSYSPLGWRVITKKKEDGEYLAELEIAVATFRPQNNGLYHARTVNLALPQSGAWTILKLSGSAVQLWSEQELVSTLPRKMLPSLRSRWITFLSCMCRTPSSCVRFAGEALGLRLRVRLSLF